MDRTGSIGSSIYSIEDDIYGSSPYLSLKTPLAQSLTPIKETNTMHLSLTLRPVPPKQADPCDKRTKDEAPMTLSEFHVAIADIIATVEQGGLLKITSSMAESDQY